MRWLRVNLTILTVVLATAVPSLANPTPPRVVLRQRLERLTANRASLEDKLELASHLRFAGLRGDDSVTCRAFAAYADSLVPACLEKERGHPRPCFHFHRWFREHTSVHSQDRMRAVVRTNLESAVSLAEQNLKDHSAARWVERPMRTFAMAVAFAEIASDYGDSLSARAIAKLCGIVDEVPTSLLPPEALEEIPRFLAMDLRRIHDPDSGAVLRQLDASQFRFCRAINDADSVVIRCCRGCRWEPVPAQKRADPDLELLLDGCTVSQHPLSLENPETAGAVVLRIVFADGVAATFVPLAGGRLVYWDNVRFEQLYPQIANGGLYRWIMSVARTPRVTRGAAEL